MFAQVGHSIQSAFFSSLDKAGCLNLDTMGQSSSDEDGELRERTYTKGLLADAEEERLKPDHFYVERFHHIEFWCGDAKSVSSRFSWGLGMQLIAKSDQTTGNQTYCSYVLKSNDLLLIFTAPYSSKLDQQGSQVPLPQFQSEQARAFFASHGLAVKAVAVEVLDAADAYRVSLANGAESMCEPVSLADDYYEGRCALAEVKLYGDVALRFITAKGFTGPFLPRYAAVPESPQAMSFGFSRLHHVIGTVPSVRETAGYISKVTGFHELLSTVHEGSPSDSCSHSFVLANCNQAVLLSLVEPPPLTPILGKEKSPAQVQTYLVHNEGPGVQLLVLESSDIFHTVREMRMRSQLGGFDLQPDPPPEYYRDLQEWAGSILTPKLLELCKQLGLLVVKDKQGVILQVCTRPLGDRPTVFIKIFQHLECNKDAGGKLTGCGFKKGHFSELFKFSECLDEKRP